MNRIPTGPESSNERLQRQLILTWILLGIVCIVFVIPTVRWWWGFGVSGTPRPITPRGELADFEKTTVELFDNVSPSVVYVNVSSRVRTPLFSTSAGGSSGHWEWLRLG